MTARFTHYRAQGVRDGAPFDELRPFTQLQAAGLGKGAEVLPDGLSAADAQTLVTQWNFLAHGGRVYSLPAAA